MSREAVGHPPPATERAPAPRRARPRPALPRWRPHDPGLLGVHNALRTAIVTTLAFYLGLEVIGDTQTALFASIGALALLVFVDFGGPPAARLAAYLGLALVGAVLVPLGTVCSTHPLVAAGAMAIVGFVVLFAGIINGYLAAGATAALLAFILPTMVPVEAAGWAPRLLGWAIACATAIPAALLLWPARPHDALRTGVAGTCRVLADLVASPSPATIDAARAALDDLHARYAATPFRPTGPTGATGALASLVEALDWLRGRASHSPAAEGAATPTPSEARLRASAAEVLRACAREIEGQPEAAPALELHERERAAVIDDLLARLEDPAVRADDGRLWATIAVAFDVRVQSYGAMEVAELAVAASGGDAREGGPRWLRFARGQGVATAIAASGRLAIAHTSVRSVWFRNSVRGSVALSLAVLFAQLASLQHEFWVVLGALSVLRSSALSTGSTVVQSLIGTTIGIVLGGVLVLAIGTDTTVLWILLPIAVFVAAYAPRAVSFAAGQAAFTVAVIVLFNLIAPTGWKVGLVRIEDVAIGCAISLVVGLLFWPSGAAALLRRSLGIAYARGAGYTAAAYGRLCDDHGGADADALRREALAAEGRLDAAFRQQLAERGGHNRDVGIHGRLMGGVLRLRRTADAVLDLSERLRGLSRPAAVADALTADACVVGDWYVAFGRALAAQVHVPEPERSDHPAGRTAAIAGVRAAARHGERAATVAAILLAFGVLHLERAREHEQRMFDAVSAS